jgi:hypothetical protein
MGTKKHFFTAKFQIGIGVTILTYFILQVVIAILNS